MQPQTSQVSMFTSSPVQNVKRNRYHCTSARTVSARRLSAILALEIVVQEDYFDRRIEGASKRRGKESKRHTEDIFLKGSASARDNVCELFSEIRCRLSLCDDFNSQDGPIYSTGYV